MTKTEMATSSPRKAVTTYEKTSQTTAETARTRLLDLSAADAWYDGVDTDCAGNDDFDQDEDGFVPDEYINLTTRYVRRVRVWPGGDCDDDPAQDDTSPAPASPTYPRRR